MAAYEMDQMERVQGDVLERVRPGPLSLPTFSGLSPISCRKKEFDAAGCEGSFIHASHTKRSQLA
jgi:hypothetical protein